jgi:hypothetical protein
MPVGECTCDLVGIFYVHYDIRDTGCVWKLAAPSRSASEFLHIRIDDCYGRQASLISTCLASDSSYTFVSGTQTEELFLLTGPVCTSITVCRLCIHVNWVLCRHGIARPQVAAG